MTTRQETFSTSPELLSAEFAPQPRSASAWRDPSGGLPIPPVDLVTGPAAEHLPAIYSVFSGVPADICWRSVAAEVFARNIAVDKRLEAASRLRALLGGSGLPADYHQPLPSALAKTHLEVPPAGARWCVYLSPFLAKSPQAQPIPADALLRRNLSFRELHSRAYQDIVPGTDMPPILVLRSPSAPAGSMPHVLEGLFRLGRALDEGLSELPTQEVPWSYVERFAHLQPMLGSVTWQR